MFYLHALNPPPILKLRTPQTLITITITATRVLLVQHIDDLDDILAALVKVGGRRAGGLETACLTNLIHPTHKN